MLYTNDDKNKWVTDTHISQFHWVKKRSNSKMLHTIQFHLFKFLIWNHFRDEEQISYCQGMGQRGGGKGRHVCSQMGNTRITVVMELFNILTFVVDMKIYNMAKFYRIKYTHPLRMITGKVGEILIRAVDCILGCDIVL